MRSFLAAALLAAPTLAQTVPDTNRATETPPPAPIEVGRTTMAPGDQKAFRIQPGANHLLLVPAAPNSPKSMTLSYRVDGGRSALTAVNLTGAPIRFTILADPNGTGGYQPAGTMVAPGDGSSATRHWPTALGSINVGGFRRDSSQ